MPELDEQDHRVDPVRLEHDGWLVVPVADDLDFYSAPRFADRIRSRTAAGARRVVVDLRAVDFMDSTGLRLLLDVARDLRSRGGQLRLAGPSEIVRRLLEVTQVAPLLPSYPDVTAACRD